jgi:dipicolinic acid synthetase, B subunit
MSKIRMGFALCGSFCTFTQILPIVAQCVQAGYQVTPIMSEISYNTDTRFGKAEYFRNQLEEITGSPIIHTIVQAEPIGPSALLDILVVAPCTGNTLGKLCNGISDTSVTLAVKAHLRNQRPVVLGVSSNDALSNSAKNVGQLLNHKHVYFVPMRQDAPEQKPRSIVADFSLVLQTAEHALRAAQLQPIYL